MHRVLFVLVAVATALACDTPTDAGPDKPTCTGGHHYAYPVYCTSVRVLIDGPTQGLPVKYRWSVSVTGTGFGMYTSGRDAVRDTVTLADRWDQTVDPPVDDSVPALVVVRIDHRVGDGGLLAIDSVHANLAFVREGEFLPRFTIHVAPQLVGQ